MRSIEEMMRARRRSAKAPTKAAPTRPTIRAANRPACRAPATARLTAKVGTAIHRAGRGIGCRRGEDISYSRRDSQPFKFARIWFRNPFAGAKNQREIRAKSNKQRL